MCEHIPAILELRKTLDYLDNMETVLMKKLEVSIHPTCWTAYHKLILEIIRVRTDVHLRRILLLPGPEEDTK